jgi:hypothetical protein
VEINPVFVNELRQSPLRRKPLQAFLLWVGLTALLMWLSQFSPGGYAPAVVPLVALPLVVPAFAAGTFAKEYEQQTWQELTLTRLTNLQVVLGKFAAALLLSMATALSLLPAMILMEYRQHQPVMFPLSGTYAGFVSPMQVPGFTLDPGAVLVAVWKLGLSAGLYVMLAMTCSRYSSNRRTALVWSYIALSLYVLMGAAIWTTTGQVVDRNTAYLSGNGYSPTAPMTDLVAPGFMGGIHLIFCSVLGLGTLVLLWVSLSEQRGYRADASSESARSWQPLAR